MSTNAEKHLNTIKELNTITESIIELAVNIKDKISIEEKNEFSSIVRQLQIHISISIELLKNDLPF